MLSKFENKLRIKFFKKSKHYLSKTIDLKALDADNKNDYNDIFIGKLDFLVIKNFISREEILFCRDQLNKLIKENNTIIEKTKTGIFIGKSLVEKNTLEEYFTSAASYHLQEKNILGFSFNDRITEVVKKISKVSSVEIPVSYTNRQYLGNSIRLLEINKAGFPVHCDKFVHSSYEKATELHTMITDENLISFFAILKNPEKGGRLFILNKSYKDTPEEIIDEMTHGDYTKVQRYIYRHDVIEVNMDEGDLILFDGGQRWHMIEPIYGKTPRISVGCFTSYNKEKDKIYFWS